VGDVAVLATSSRGTEALVPAASLTAALVAAALVAAVFVAAVFVAAALVEAALVEAALAGVFFAPAVFLAAAVLVGAVFAAVPVPPAALVAVFFGAAAFATGERFAFAAGERFADDAAFPAAAVSTLTLVAVAFVAIAWVAALGPSAFVPAGFVVVVFRAGERFAMDAVGAGFTGADFAGDFTAAGFVPADFSVDFTATFSVDFTATGFSAADSDAMDFADVDATEFAVLFVAAPAVLPLVVPLDPDPAIFVLVWARRLVGAEVVFGAILPGEVSARRLLVVAFLAEAVSEPALRAVVLRAAMASPRCRNGRATGTPRTPEGGKNTERTRVRQTCHTIWADPDARSPLCRSGPARVIGVPYPPLSAFNPAVSGIPAGPDPRNFFKPPNRATAVPAPPDRVGARRR
jgi:hypothetical protein